jgi:hypothetical protein
VTAAGVSPAIGCCVYNSIVMKDSADGLVPATELRCNLAAYLDAARSGATYVVTRGSRITARLMPPVDEGETASDD